jgi:16S rRNA (guanine(966)-N(2))-methyltransferase RsmD
VKESLFGIIGADIIAGKGATMLDLFGGTGSVGIEALSRGASFVRFIDVNRQAVATIRENLAQTGLAVKAEVIRMDAFTFLKQPADKAFDYVYIAPPQYQGMWSRALLSLDAQPAWMSEDAWVIVQIHPTEFGAVDEENRIGLNSLQEFDQRKYGSTMLVFFERKPSLTHSWEYRSKEGRLERNLSEDRKEEYE